MKVVVAQAGVVGVAVVVVECYCFFIINYY